MANKFPLFEAPSDEKLIIPGLQYISDFLSQAEHDFLLHKIDEQTWLGDLKRRVQHYGYKYDYKARCIDASMKIADLPDWAMRLAKKLCDQGFFPEIPDQLIVNEYLPG